MKWRIVLFAILISVLGAIAWGAMRLVKANSAASAGPELPTTKVKRGRVNISVAARGDLQGGNTEMLMVPPTSVDSTAVTFLREPGEHVEAGDTVAEFDTTQLEYNLREAQADLAEAEQQVILAEANSKATDEDNKYALLSAQSDVKIAELEVRKKPVVGAIVARQNDIALEAAQRRLHQAEQNMANKTATAVATVNIQKAMQNRAKVTADMVQKTMDSMTLKAKTAGYVNIQPNMRAMMNGGTIQPVQIGDQVYSGMAVAQIPDLKSWEVSARVGEVDRGHLSVDQKVMVSVVALPGKSFPGHVKSLGGTSGPNWDRRFDCRIQLEQPAPEMRPGMTSNMVITAESLDNVLWIPSQALYESDGKAFVYLKGTQGFMPHDITLLNRSESQAVISGLNEGDVVAMTNPDQQNKPSTPGQNGAMKALQK